MTQSLKKCVACSRCLSFCPVFLASGKEELSPKSKNMLFECIVEDPARLDFKKSKDLAEMCVSCGRCATACAQHLSIPDRLAELRAKKPGWEQYLWRIWISQGDALWPVLGTIGKALGDTPGKGMAASVKALGRKAATRPWIRVLDYDTSAGGRTVYHFAGCTARRVHPEWVATGKAILKGLGYTVADAQEECCGGTLLSAGLRSSALNAMDANVRAWRDVGRPLITTACTSCQYSLAKYVQYEELFDSDEEAGRWRNSLVNLASLWGGTTFQVEAPPASLHWHAPCHGTVCKDDEAWLKRTAGKAVSTPAGIHCCGLGGVLQLTNRALSTSFAGECWEAMSPPPGAQVLTGCSGCTIQLASARPQGVDVAHWLDAVQP